MSFQAYPSGYLVYLLELLVPGLGFGELFGAWKSASSLAERIGMIFGIGLAVDTSVLMVKTSGLSVDGYRLAGVGPDSVYLVIGIGAVALAASVAMRRDLSFPTKPKAVDAVVGLLVLALGLIALLYLQKYPYFPDYPFEDFGNHASIVEGLVSGSMTSIPGGVLYYGVHFQLASTLALVGGQAVVTNARTMAILAVLSPLIVYMASLRIFSSQKAALIVAAVYVFSGTIWYTSVFESGLYPNFFGVIAVLFFFVAFRDLSSDLTRVGAWAIFMLSLVMLYFSHYTSVTIIPALLVIPLLQLRQSRTAAKRTAIPLLVSIIPGVMGLIVYPQLASQLVSLLSYGGNISQTTPLANVLAPIPVLSYMAAEVESDAQFVLLFLFSAIYLYKCKDLRDAFILVPIAWFMSLVLVAPLDISAWRFSFEALVPLTLMAAYGISLVVPPMTRVSRTRARSGSQSQRMQYVQVGLVLLLTLSPILILSLGEDTLADSLTDSQGYAQAEKDTYVALQWIQSNTPANASFLSVSDSQFRFSDLYVGRSTSYLLTGNQTIVMRAVKVLNDSYTIVTEFITPAPGDPTLPPSEFPWDSIQSTPSLSLIYNATGVEIFKVNTA